MNDLRYRYWRKNWVKQHNPTSISKALGTLYPHSKVIHGKKGQGDVVIINLKDTKGLHKYLSYFYGIDRIEQIGIYTNVYFSTDFFSNVIKEIIGDNGQKDKEQ